MLRFTICFIRQGEKVLLLNREKPAWMGSWNGVGGKLKEDEKPEQCILREIYEETGISLNEVCFKGTVTWFGEGEREFFGGMYAFVADLPEDFQYVTPIKTSEGILDWKPISWIMHPENTGIAHNVPFFLEKMLYDEKKYEHRCIFEKGSLKAVEHLDFK